MFRDDQDAMDATTDPARWKNGRRFQSHLEVDLSALPPPAAVRASIAHHDAQGAQRALATLPAGTSHEARQRAQELADSTSRAHRDALRASIRREESR